VQLLFELDSHPVELTGEVICVDHQEIMRDRIAVRFVGVAEQTRALIRELVVRTLDLQAQDSTDVDE
jgi:hypothetical protein